MRYHAKKWLRWQKTLEEEIAVMTIFHQEQTRNENLEGISNKDGFLYYWKVKQKGNLHVPADLALTEACKEQRETIQQLLEAHQLDSECRQIVNIVDKPQINFTIDMNSLLLCVLQLNGAVCIYILPVYYPMIRSLYHYLTLAGHPGERGMY